VKKLGSWWWMEGVGLKFDSGWTVLDRRQSMYSASVAGTFAWGLSKCKRVLGA